jgi:hypothetical protein
MKSGKWIWCAGQDVHGCNVAAKFRREFGEAAQVDEVCIADDCAAFGLAEGFGESDDRDCADRDHVREDEPRADRGQLVHIAYEQDMPAISA